MDRNELFGVVFMASLLANVLCYIAVKYAF